MTIRNISKREAAHNLVNNGFFIIPLAVNAKCPLKGSNGSLDAFNDHNMVEQIWGENPHLNIGICTGKKYDLLIIDIDRKNGKDGLEALYSEFGNEFFVDAAFLICQTPTGGLHLYFRALEYEVANATDILDGVDIRGKHGYVVAPPSDIWVNGNLTSYKWFDPTSCSAANPPAFAENLFKRTQARKIKIKEKASSEKPAKLAASNFNLGFTKGERDEGLYSLACSFRSHSIDITTAKKWIVMAANNCSPAFKAESAIAKVEYVYNKYPEGYSW